MHDDDFWTSLIAAFGMLLVVEGVCYALFPHTTRKIAEIASGLGYLTLRVIGLAALVVGVLMVWVARRLLV